MTIRATLSASLHRAGLKGAEDEFAAYRGKRARGQPKGVTQQVREDLLELSAWLIGSFEHLLCNIELSLTEERRFRAIV